MNIPRCGTKAIDLQDLPGMVSFSAVFEACGATHRPGESSQLMKPFTQTHDRRHERPKETNMTHLKTFAFGLILLPAMAIAQAGAEGYYKEGQPIPGAQDHPGFTDEMETRGAPDEAYYRDESMPMPGEGDHPGLRGEMRGEGGDGVDTYYQEGQPVPGAGDHPITEQ